MSDEIELRASLAQVGRLVYDRRLTYGSGGNISARLEDSMLITPSGTCKGLLRPEEMIKVDLENGTYSGPRRPSMETPFHRAIYNSRKDVGGIIHSHPLSCTVLALAGIQLRSTITPEGILVLGSEVPMVPYATPGSDELAQGVASALQKRNACLLRKHGALAVGKDLMEAFNRMETLEYLAMLQLESADIGRLEPLSEEEVAKILKEKENR